MTPSRPTSPDLVERGAALRFSTPIRLALVAVVAMAVVALTFLLLPHGTPPLAQGSPSATASIEEPSPSTEPSEAPQPTSSPVATPASTPAPSAVWTGLTWSDPVTPPFVVHLNDLVPWSDGYVAVGHVPVGARLSQAAFLTSPDGLNWTVTYQIDPVGERYPEHLVVAGDTLFAFSPRATDDVEIVMPSGGNSGPLIWSSTDGVGWTLIDSTSWEGGWRGAGQHVGTLPPGWDPTQHDIETGLVDVASGSSGIVAIGNAFGHDAMTPIILHSTDGQSWAAAALPAGSDSALLNAVVELDGRFVITGAVGAGADPTAATAAAWYSDDGLAWIRATVEPDESLSTAGGEFGPLWAADDGLLTCSGSRYMTAGGWRYMFGWESPDGATWRFAAHPGPHRGCDWSASDGIRIVSLGPRDHASPTPWPGITVASTSTDGAEWQPLELSSTLTDRLERFWVVPGGVIYAGEQSFWFGTAIER